MSPRVLLVDDSRTMRQVLRVYLMGGRYELAEADCGRAALELVMSGNVDLVVADVRMADMDGIELTRAVRASEATLGRRVPIVLITGERSETLRGRGLEAGADDLLFKPLSSEILVEVVTRLLRAQDKA